jgi:hypothetical protein
MVYSIRTKAGYAEAKFGRYPMRVGTGLKAGGIVQDAIQQAEKARDGAVVFVRKAGDQAVIVTRDAIDGTTLVVNWMADLLNRL